MKKLITQVDEHDRAIGPRPKKDFFRTNLIHRSSHLLVFNSKGELLLQKRALTKNLYPGTYDFSVGAVVDYNESYEECIKREMKEELGIRVPYKKLFKYKCFDEVDKAFRVVYSATCDGPFKTSEETETIKWIDLNQLKEDIVKNPKNYNLPFIEGMKIYFKKYT